MVKWSAIGKLGAGAVEEAHDAAHVGEIGDVSGIGAQSPYDGSGVEELWAGGNRAGRLLA